VRKPNFVVPGGSVEKPYMQRWWVIPKNDWLNIYVHRLQRDDDARGLHDHPWWNISFLLAGSYIEVVPDFSKAPTPYTRIFDLPVLRKVRTAGSFVFRRCTDSHRLELPVVNGEIQRVWSLFITGRKRRSWGFHCAKGWVDADEFDIKGCG
jgi:hypothetical protein